MHRPLFRIRQISSNVAFIRSIPRNDFSHHRDVGLTDSKRLFFMFPLRLDVYPTNVQCDPSDYVTLFIFTEKDIYLEPIILIISDTIISRATDV